MTLDRESYLLSPTRPGDTLRSGMAFEDNTARCGNLRCALTERSIIRSEVKAGRRSARQQWLNFFHPRIEEVAALLPVGWGSGVAEVTDREALVESTPWASER